MTTLATIKAEIADDLVRSDLTSQIASAITSAIKFYQRQRFYFNETRSETFATVVDQADYDSADDTEIPNFLGFDLLHLTYSGSRYPLGKIDQRDMEFYQDTNAASGMPSLWSYYDETIWLYPIPDSTSYTITMMGPKKIAAPATDSEASNVWMVDAYELIRCRAKKYIAVHVLRDNEMAQWMDLAEQDALRQLVAEGTMKMGSGMIQATEF